MKNNRQASLTYARDALRSRRRDQGELYKVTFQQTEILKA